MTRFRPHAVLLAACACWTTFAGAQALAPDRFYAKTAPSVWQVVGYDINNKPFVQGSAVVVAKETLLTNCHVLRGVSRLVVKQDNASYEATAQHLDPDRDMCQITASHLPAPAVEIADSDKLSVGQRVYALGNPQGLELTLSDGLISALRKDKKGDLFLIQTSAPISPGSSGGGLFDDQGRLIGLTTLGFTQTGNLNFAVPINWLRDLPARGAAYEIIAKAILTKRMRDSKGSDRSAAVILPAVEKPAPVAAAPAPRPAPAPAPAPVPVRPPAAAGAPSASGYADLNDLSKFDAYRPTVKQAYMDFLKRPLPRAFAVSENGGSYQAWGRIPRDPADSPDPAVRVIPSCEKFHRSRCHLYAVDETVVYRPGT